jgi:DNA-binding PadR family transcriptional regulator
VRAAILLLLAEEPRHGYDLIREIESRSAGAWTPSPGSVYPTLQGLEDEGLIVIDLVEGRKVAALTEAGRDWTARHPGSLDTLFARDEADESAQSLRVAVARVAEAAVTIERQRDRPELAARAAVILGATRRDLYRLLADDEG